MQGSIYSSDLIEFEIDSWDYKVLLESLGIECDSEYNFVTPETYATTFIIGDPDLFT